MADPKTVAIVQSNYVPWKGYFDLIARVDEFILLDDVQYTRRDWRNRNRIKTPQGPAWLTIAVKVKGRYHQRIDETMIDDRDWPRRHWETFCQHYRDAPSLDYVRAALEPTYARLGEIERLSDVNRALLEACCRALHIGTRLSWSTDYEPAGTKTERLLTLCRQAAATRYVSGPSARDYLDEAAFGAGGIEVEWMRYDGYAEYEQVHPPFDHHVSVLDLLACTGEAARDHLLTERPAHHA